MTAQIFPVFDQSFFFRISTAGAGSERLDAEGTRFEMLKSNTLASTGGRKGVAFAADGQNPESTGGHMPETPVKPGSGVRAQVAA